MVLNPSLGEDSWKGTSATPRGRFHQHLGGGGGWELTLTQAHNCTNGDNTHLRFILYSMTVTITTATKIGFLRLYIVLQELFWCNEYMQHSPTCPEFWSNTQHITHFMKIRIRDWKSVYWCLIVWQWKDESDRLLGSQVTERNALWMRNASFQENAMFLRCYGKL